MFEGEDFFSNYEKTDVGNYTIYQKIGNKNKIFILKNGNFLTELEAQTGIFTKKLNNMLRIGVLDGKLFYLDGKQCTKSKPIGFKFACCNVDNVNTLMVFDSEDGWKKAHKKATKPFKCD